MDWFIAQDAAKLGGDVRHLSHSVGWVPEPNEDPPACQT